MVKLNSPMKSPLHLKIPEKNIFVLLTLFNFIFKREKENCQLLIFFWTTLSKILFTNTGRAVNTLFTNKACLILKYMIISYTELLLKTVIYIVLQYITIHCIIVQYIPVCSIIIFLLGIFVLLRF